MLAATSALRTRPRPAWASLLGRFYGPAGLPLPRFHRLKPDRVPEPYNTLLVHSSDMTSALERFYQQDLRLWVLDRECLRSTYWRQVIIKLANDARPVEFGAIRIHLDRLPAAARKLVLDEQHPLGSILLKGSIAQSSSPQAFFRLRSDAHIAAVLGLREECDLYGRHNLLHDASGNTLAEVVEILAPAHQRCLTTVKELAEPRL